MTPNTTAQSLFLAQLASTLFMAGIIWFVQIVHYPLFLLVGKSAFPAYEHQHASRTGWVVFPPMLVELLTALAALIPSLRPPEFSQTAALASAALMLVIWISTALLQIPLHNTLQSTSTDTSARATTIHRLILSNWLRTAAWTARSALLLTALIAHTALTPHRLSF